MRLHRRRLRGRATFTDPVVSGGALPDLSQYIATINWGDHNPDGTPDVQTLHGTATGGSPISYNATTQIFSLNPSHTFAYNADPAPINVTISDGWPGSTSSTVTVPVTITDQPLTLTPATSLVSTTGQGITQTLATFTDPDPAANGVGVDASGNYTAVIDWGDGSGEDTVGIVSSDASGDGTSGSNVYTVSGSHAYATAETYSVNVTIYDDTNSQSVSTTTPITCTVNDPLVSIDSTANSVAEGTLYTLPLLDKTNGTPLSSLTVDWGDGNGPQVVPLTGGSVPASLTNTYQQPLPDTTITVTATASIDGQNVTSTYSIPMDVLDEPVPIINATLEKISSGWNSWRYELTGTFTDAGVDDSHTACVSWGDGSGAIEVGVTEINGQGTLPTFTHTYYAAGTYHPMLMINSNSSVGTVTTQQFTLVVGSPVITLTGASSELTATQGTPSSATLASFTDGSGSNADYASYNGDATVQWGDGAVHTATLSPGDGANIDITDPMAPDVSGSGVPVRIVISTTGSHKEYESVHDTANITDPDPIITNTYPLSETARTAFSGVLIGTFTTTSGDTNSADFSAGLGDAAGDNLTATVGDYADGVFPLYASGTFTLAGSPELTLEVDDVGGASSSAEIDGSTISDTVPAAPQTLIAASNPVSGGIDLNWDACSGAAWYEVYRNGGTSPIAHADATAYNDPYGVPTDSYQVFAANDIGPSLLPSPTAIAQTSTTSDPAPVITATYTLVAVEETPFSGIKIASFTDANGDTNPNNYLAFISDDAQDAITATVKTDPSGGFDLYAAGTFEESDPQCLTLQVFHAPGCASASCTLPSSVPMQLSASAVDSSDVYLEWSPVDGAVAYDISRDGTYVTTIDDAATTEYTDDSVSVIGHTTYDYTVTAVGWAGTLDTATASATTPDAAPVALDHGLNADGSYNPNYIVAQNQTLTVSAADGVLANDTDADDDTLTAAVLDRPANGSVSVDSDGGFTYTPNTGYTGPDTFTYTADDGYGGTASATVNVDVVDAPQADNAAFEVVGGSDFQSFVQGVDGNDSLLFCSLLPDPVGTTHHGTLSMDEYGRFTYTPDPGFIGTDTYQWQATDRYGQSESATLQFNVVAPPLAPADHWIAVWSGTHTVYWDGTITHGAGQPDLLTNALLPSSGGIGVYAVIDQQPSSGTVTAGVYGDNGGWDYEDDGTSASDSFTYYLTYDGYRSEDATVYVTTCSVGGEGLSSYTPPLLWGLSGGYLNAGPFYIPAPTGQTLSESATIYQPCPPYPASYYMGGLLYALSTDYTASDATVITTGGGTIAAQPDGSFTYTPPSSTFVGNVAFTYTINGSSGPSVPMNGIISVGSPFLRAMTFGVTTPAGQSIDVTASELGALSGKTASMVNEPANGSLQSDGHGGYAYSPGTSGNDYFSYDLTDGTNTSNVAWVGVDVTLPTLGLTWNDSSDPSANDASGNGEPLYLDDEPDGQAPNGMLSELDLHSSLDWNSYPAGTVVTLSWQNTADDGATVRLWSSGDPSTATELTNLSWTIGTDQVPNAVYVDAGSGDSASDNASDPADIQFTLTATLPGTSSSNSATHAGDAAGSLQADQAQPSGVAALAAAAIAAAPRPDVAGPDVTQWFINDLLGEQRWLVDEYTAILARWRWRALVYPFGPARAAYEMSDAFGDLVAKDLSYKWMDFGGGTGKGYATVTLAGEVIRKNQLGNIAFAYLAYADPPPSSAIYGAIAYAENRVPGTKLYGGYWKDNYGDWKDKPRCDNLQAFSVGYRLALLTSEGHHWSFDEALSFLLDPSTERNDFMKLYTGTADDWASQGLYWVPEDGGFFTNVLTPSTKPYDGPSGSAFAAKLISEYERADGKTPFKDWANRWYENYEPR